jgi:GNAT superfamily N-acetyltransferase
VQIRPIRVDEGLQLRDFRLRSLADAPAAFGETLAQAQARPEAFWHERAARNAAGIEAITFVAVEDEGRWYGTLTGFFPPDDPHAVTIVNLWVDPAARGLYIDRALREAIAGWARSRGAAQLQLWVVENSRTEILYKHRWKFVHTGKTKPLGADPSLRAVHMIREL